VSGYWRSVKGENHGIDSRPGDVWVEVDEYGASHFSHTWGSTTYNIEVGENHLRVNEGGDYLFVTDLGDPPTDTLIRTVIKTYYVGRTDGESRGRIMLQHQLRELLNVPACFR
jgi:hypothetical protein